MHRALRVIFALYFATHIPITLLVDAQAVLPPAWFPGFARRLVDYHVRTFHDPLMRAPQPGWFRALVACELGLQLPFFFVALRALAARDGATIPPTLHVLGRADGINPPEMGLEVAECCGAEAMVHWHDGGHIVPSDAASCEVFRAFLARITERPEG